MYEYKIIDMDSEAESEINRLAQQGWRLTHIVAGDDLFMPRAVMERPKRG